MNSSFSFSSPFAAQPTKGAEAPVFCEHSKLIQQCLRSGIKINPEIESESCGNSGKRYQFGLCKPYLIDRFKLLRNVINEVRSHA